MKKDKKEIVAAAETHGFIYIDEGILLDEPYTGRNKEFEFHGSWWERYFEYI